MISMIVRTIWILLYKPFMGNREIDIPGVDAACARLAEEIHALFRLYEVHLPPSLSNVLHVFAAFSAAHIDMSRLKGPDTEAVERARILERISFTARLLADSANLRPTIKSSVDRLTEQRDAVLSEQRARYDPVKDVHVPLPPLPNVSMPMADFGAIDFSALSDTLFAENIDWPMLYGDDEVRLLTLHGGA